MIEIETEIQRYKSYRSISLETPVYYKTLANGSWKALSNVLDKVTLADRTGGQ